MPIHETEAVVLRQYPLSEADRIIIFFTREFGKVRAVGKGVKKLKSRSAPIHEPLTHMALSFWTREGVELSRIRGCEKIHSYLGPGCTLEQFYAYTYFAELVNEFVQENNPNEPLFRLLLASLRTGESRGISEGLVRYFELWMLRLNGLLPNYAYCSSCRKYVKGEGFFASPSTGQGHCSDCAAGTGVHVGRAGTELLESILELSPERFVSKTFPENATKDMERLTRKLFDLHLERRLRSYEPLRSVLRGS